MTRPEVRFGPVLVGMRGVGKSTIAPGLAQRLGLGTIDADSALENRQRKSIADIFRQVGECGFRELERTFLLDDLLLRTGVVLATGGGAVLHGEVRRALCQRATIWLWAAPEVLAERIAASDRPTLSGEPILCEIQNLCEQRAALYRQVSKFDLDVSSLSPDEVVDSIYDALVAFSDHPADWEAASP